MLDCRAGGQIGGALFGRAVRFYSSDPSCSLSPPAALLQPLCGCMFPDEGQVKQVFGPFALGFRPSRPRNPGPVTKQTTKETKHRRRSKKPSSQSQFGGRAYSSHGPGWFRAIFLGVGLLKAGGVFPGTSLG